MRCSFAGRARRAGELKQQSQGMYHFQHRGDLRVAVGGQRLVQALRAQPGLLRDQRHSSGVGYVSQRRNNQTLVSLFLSHIEVGCHVLLGLQMLSWVPRSGLVYAFVIVAASLESTGQLYRPVPSRETHEQGEEGELGLGLLRNCRLPCTAY